jgi:hypothetical protein
MKHCESGVSWSTENCFSDSGNGLDALLLVTWLYKATCKQIHFMLMFLFNRYHKKSAITVHVVLIYAACAARNKLSIIYIYRR